MKNKVIRRLLAIGLSAAMLAAAGTVASGYESSQEEKKAAQEEEIALSLSGDAETAEGETEEETAAEAEEKEEPETEAVVYEALETTSTGENAVNAIDVSNIVENSMPSIVSITKRSVQEVESYFYGRQQIEVEGSGSGIIIAQNSTELLIATNNHVASDAEELTVCFTAEVDNPDKLVVPALVKGTNSKHDLAVVAVKLSDIDEDVLSQLKIATLGNSENLKVGETAIVIGNALGEGITVTTGIVSALEREIMTEAGKFTELQTDAAINFGCSGGAILNAKGEVIAIVQAKATDYSADDMGYGIPTNQAIPVLKELINRQTRETVKNRGYMGITVVPVSEEAKEMYSMPAGAFVYNVNEGSGAEAAGIKKGDIVTKFDGIDITSSDELIATLDYYEAGETVTVEVQTAEGGVYVAKEVEVVLQEGSTFGITEESEEEQDQEEQKEDQKEDQNEPENDYWDDDRQSDGREYYGNDSWGSYGDDYWGDFFQPFGFGF